MRSKRSGGALYSAAGVLAVALLLIGIVTFGRGYIVSAFASAYGAIAPGQVSYSRTGTTTDAAIEQKPNVVHLPTPSIVKAIYMTQCAVGTQSYRDDLVHLIETTELNAIVIDIRDYTGKISFPSSDPILAPMVSEKCGARDMQAFIKELHEKNIYVIGRITTFQNPYYTSVHPEMAVQKKCGSSTELRTCGVWKDYKGLSFVDVGATPYWETVVTLARAAHDIGFDELNFDYVRYPSDGPMAEAQYIQDHKNKQEMLETFFKYLHDQLAPTGVVLSVDLFGMTATNYDDLNIGQVLERALPYFDFIDPMVYPSHYPKGFNGYTDVNAHPYDIVHFSMQEALKRTIAATTTVPSYAHTPIASTSPQLYAKPQYAASKMRPWLQSFDYPVHYTPEMVADQIRANTDAGLSSYLFWDPANKYASLRQVLCTENACESEGAR